MATHSVLYRNGINLCIWWVEKNFLAGTVSRNRFHGVLYKMVMRILFWKNNFVSKLTSFVLENSSRRSKTILFYRLCISVATITTKFNIFLTMPPQIYVLCYPTDLFWIFAQSPQTGPIEVMTIMELSFQIR